MINYPLQIYEELHSIQICNLNIIKILYKKIDLLKQLFAFQ